MNPFNLLLRKKFSKRHGSHPLNGFSDFIADNYMLYRLPADYFNNQGYTILFFVFTRG
jgi:hypothetical protein